MEQRDQDSINPKIIGRPIDRDMNTALFMLRAFELGIAVGDLQYLSVGMVFDMIIEKQNDKYDYPVLATQEDIDRL